MNREPSVPSTGAAQVVVLTRIPYLDPAGMSEGRRNAGETAESYFHPSRPSGLGCPVRRKGLIQHRKSVHGAGKTAIHLGNPGLKKVVGMMFWICGVPGSESMVKVKAPSAIVAGTKRLGIPTWRNSSA